MIPGKNETEDKTGTADASGGKGQVEDILGEARKSGALQPLEEYMRAEGIEGSAEDVMRAAQLNDATHGKTPEELVAMCKEDPDLIPSLLGSEPENTGGFVSPDDMMQKKRREAMNETE